MRKIKIVNIFRQADKLNLSVAGDVWGMLKLAECETKNKAVNR